MVDVLERDATTGYTKVRLPAGTEGWVQGKYVEKGESIALRFSKLERDLKASRQLNSEQGEALSGLEADLQRANDLQAQGTANVAQLENEVERLKGQISMMDEKNMMGWMLRGGALALGGVILGLLLPHLPKRRRRNNDWF
jgi:SH3 domain protein